MVGALHWDDAVVASKACRVGGPEWLSSLDSQLSRWGSQGLLPPAQGSEKETPESCRVNHPAINVDSAIGLQRPGESKQTT